MHFSTQLVLLTAGSIFFASTVGAKHHSHSKATPQNKTPTLATPDASKNQAGSKVGDKGPVQNGALAKKPTSAPGSNSALSPVSAQSKPNIPSVNSTVNTISKQDAALMAKADEAAIVSAEYAKKYKALNPGGLNNNQAPPISFQLGNTINGNDYSQTSYGGNNLRDGASTNTNTDNSMNDYRTQVGNGATVTGNTVTASRNGNNGRMARRSLNDDTYQPSDDGHIVAKDFSMLIKLMKQNSKVKNQVLYEFAGIPGLRPIVEHLIQTHTNTDGQLTMNNLAKLVDKMELDKDTEDAVVKAFNSNLVYAFTIEQILSTYHKKGSDLEKREFDDDYLWFDVRGSDVDELALLARRLIDIDYSRHVARWLEDEGVWFDT